jgi:hypothetical protein
MAGLSDEWDRRSGFVVCQAAALSFRQSMTDHEGRWSVPPGFTSLLHGDMQG